MNKLTKILQLLELANEHELEILNKIEIIDEKRVVNDFLYTICIDEPLPPELYVKIANINYDDIKIKVKIAKIKQINNHHVKKYLDYISDQHIDLINFKRVIDNYYFDFILGARLIEFKYSIEHERDEINHLIKEIVDLLKNSFGLIELNFEINENEEFKQRMIEKQLMLDEQKKQAIKNHQAKQSQKEVEKTNSNYKIDKTKIIDLNNLLNGMNNVNIEGEIYKIDIKETAKAKTYRLFIHDYTSSYLIKYVSFLESQQANKKVLEETILNLKIGDWIVCTVDIRSDQFENEVYGLIKKIYSSEKPKKYIRQDLEKEKRIELTAHSKMSSFDGIIDVDELMKFAHDMHYGSIAITDRFNIQSYPEVQKLAKKYNIKPIYGVEVCVLPSIKISLNNPSVNKPISELDYVVFDLETSGLYPSIDDIIEFGGIKYRNGVMVDKLQFFIKPTKPISDNITEITNITNDDLNDAISQEQGIQKILDFIGDSVLIAHNAINFDFRFLCHKAAKYLNRELTNPVIDTLHIVRAIYPNWKNHTLQKTCNELKVEYGEDKAHRADYDALVLNECWNIIKSELAHNFDVKQFNDLNIKLSSNRMNAFYHSDFVYIYPKNNEGLRKINELISISHTDTLYMEPKIMYETLEMNRNNLIIAPSPVDGEIMYIALNGTDWELKKAINKYDYIFVSSPENFLPFINKDEITRNQIQEIIKKIILFSKAQNKHVVAVSDAYYINPLDKKYQEVYLYAKALNGRRHRYYRYNSLPNQHIRTTNEMKNEFSFLEDDNIIQEIVVNNSWIFNDQIEMIEPIKDGLFPPKMENVNELLQTTVYETAHKIYGENLPEIVQKRLTKELDSIISHNFSVVYWISHLLVKKSQDDGYSVGSRGSVGSSLVATMLKITDVNPLPPHYICNQCKYTEFRDDVDDGFDLMPKNCVQCQNGIMYGEGHDIPFETFLGFKGDKVPDIDLNFSGVYQPKAHNFIKEIFGDKHAFRAGTISTIAEKTCYSIVKEYFNESNQTEIKGSLIDLYVKKCENVKRTTGQHPGGILIVPKEYSVFDFTPYNFPADDKKSDWYTTHYAFEYLHDSLLKFDILGHDNPTILKRLKDLTGVDEKEVPNYDQNVMKLFTTSSVLNLENDGDNLFSNGAITIPEFGTKFIREMLDDTQPQTFADLVRISGLSHGTNVYLGNAKDLIKKQNLKLKNVIACRDDIMIYLIQNNIEPSIAFKIMEDVRKGKKIKDEYKNIMIKHNIPNWYIDSCNKIQYMFPKAHAVAYVMHAWKFAWYKIYYPLAYYAIFLSIKSESLDIATVSKGRESIKARINEINGLLNNKKTANDVKKKDIDSLVILEVCLEMSYRNIKVRKPDIFLSDATEFIIHNNEIIAPFNCVDGIGDDVAKSIIEARTTKPFVSLDDVIQRTKLNKTNISRLEELGVFDNLPKSGQVSLFDL